MLSSGLSGARRVTTQASIQQPTAMQPAQILAALRGAELLTSVELAELESASQGNVAAVSGALDALTKKGRLTPLQREMLLAGEGRNLCLSQYRLKARLGAGGMGQVFLAEHVMMDRHVALKVIASRYSSDPDAMRRFRREVRIVARLNHPNIVQAHDAAEANGLHFLVMEYVQGVELGSLVERSGPLTEARACWLMHQAALALQHAFEQGLTHGDIKPANLLVTAAGTLKILDFGLARWIRSSAEDAGVGGTNCEEALAGTPDYLPPEVTRDPRLADIRSDLYSLGCTFFYLLSAKPPFYSDSWPHTLFRHQHDPVPDLCAGRQDVSKECSAIVSRLLAKSPDDRFQTPQELAVALRNLLVADDRARMLDSAPIEVSEIPTRCSDAESTLPSFKQLEEKATAAKPKAAMPSQWKSVPLHSGRAGLWSAAVLAAVGIGLALSWFTARSAAKTRLAPDASTASEEIRSVSFSISQAPDKKFDTLAAAVSAASDCDTICISGRGHVPTGPIQIHDKRIIIRAGGVEKLRLEFDRPRTAPPWQALIRTNRDLSLDGIDLTAAAASSAGGPANVTHLIYVERGALSMSRCRLESPGGTALIVCRGCPQVSLQGCFLNAWASALIEDRCPHLFISRSEIRTCDPDGAAVVLLPPSEAGSPTSRIDIEQSRICAGRVLAIPGASAGDWVQEDELLSLERRLTAIEPIGRVKLNWQDSRHEGVGGNPRRAPADMAQTSMNPLVLTTNSRWPR
jgi:serine/threonine protein kinase